ncbi:MAG: iron dicitrate transport regulator FecR [Cyanobium sp. NAT70]|nr:iron dicitrate transport regulator FecR [Cyanobium sp. NAT70]|tara:strand:- start:6 stop:728 length:723 start_codon:yes stop_codon:yes gene_type:complete
MHTPRLLLTGSLLGCLLVNASPPAHAAADLATIQEILDGDQLYIDSKKAKVKETAQTPQVISTGDSRGQLQFSGNAVGRINRQSLLKLGSSCFLLNKGQILVSGRQDGCTRSNRMSVRGTNYLLEVDADGNADLAVLEGSVVVESTEGKEEPVTVEAGQRLKLNPAGVVLSVLKLVAGDYQTILAGPMFSGFTQPVPGFSQLERYLNLNVPGVNLPLSPSIRVPIPTTPTTPPISIPRFF